MDFIKNKKFQDRCRKYYRVDDVGKFLLFFLLVTRFKMLLMQTDKLFAFSSSKFYLKFIIKIITLYSRV